MFLGTFGADYAMEYAMKKAKTWRRFKVGKCTALRGKSGKSQGEGENDGPPGDGQITVIFAGCSLGIGPAFDPDSGTTLGICAMVSPLRRS